MLLYNRVDKKLLKKRLAEDNTPRTTVSFYKYVEILDPHEYRDHLYAEWESIGCMGRIFIAEEGIIAQMSVPSNHWDALSLIHI